MANPNRLFRLSGSPQWFGSGGGNGGDRVPRLRPRRSPIMFPNFASDSSGVELGNQGHTVTDRPPPASVALAFLTVIQDAGGWVGGYLVTNAWGRPLEFRLTSAVQPNKVQSVLYGPTLAEYLHADVIGKALVEKTSIRPDLIITDLTAMLGLRSRVDIPVIGILKDGAADAATFSNPRSSAPLLLSPKFASDEIVIANRLEGVDPAVDLAEPFDRIREAVIEARKMGATNRAA
jgi:hypothetical protein